MGVDSSVAQFLCGARALDVDFASTLTLGRQFFRPAPADLAAVFSAIKVDQDAATFRRDNVWAEPFFRLLGAKTVDSLDASNYQSATYIHDLNTPIPKELESRFSCVFDGGTVEHVFNCPQAYQNCMSMVRPGGHFIHVGVCNNYAGHGFWQFSPELLFRIFSPDNGFQVVTVLIHEVVKGGRWFVVTDPVSVRDRVQIVNTLPTYILAVARREAVVPIFRKPPQQSDYEAAWKADQPDQAANESASRHRNRPDFTRLIPSRVRRVVKAALGLGAYYDPRHFRPVTVGDVLHGRLK